MTRDHDCHATQLSSPLFGQQSPRHHTGHYPLPALFSATVTSPVHAGERHSGGRQIQSTDTDRRGIGARTSGTAGSQSDRQPFCLHTCPAFFRDAAERSGLTISSALRGHHLSDEKDEQLLSDTDTCAPHVDESVVRKTRFINPLSAPLSRAFSPRGSDVPSTGVQFSLPQRFKR